MFYIGKLNFCGFSPVPRQKFKLHRPATPTRPARTPAGPGCRPGAPGSPARHVGDFCGPGPVPRPGTTGPAQHPRGPSPAFWRRLPTRPGTPARYHRINDQTPYIYIYDRKTFQLFLICLNGPVGKRCICWGCVRVMQGPFCGQVVACVTKVFSLKIASSPICPFLEHEERPSKGATYMVWDHEADSEGWVGGRGASL